MMFQAVDLGLTIDYGIDRTGSILQRKTNGEWQDYLVDGEHVIYPFDVNQYRLESIGSSQNRGCSTVFYCRIENGRQ